MARLYTGIDIGAEHLKLAVCSEQGVVQAVTEEVPDGLVREGRVTSLETMSGVIRDAARKHRITTKNCAIVLHATDVFTRRITIPAMTVDELTLNLPFEFKDYIADDKDKYNFDYAVLGTRHDAAGVPIEMDILAAAAPKELIERCDRMLRRAGFRLKAAAPDVMAYANIIAAYEKRCASMPVPPAPPSADAFGQPSAEDRPLPRDYCFLDVGPSNTKAYLFPQGRYEVTRMVDFGTLHLSAAIADHFSVDAGLARTYLFSDYEGAQRIQPCLDLYDRLGVEIARIVSFFNFNYPQSQLEALYYCGIGTGIAPLMEALRSHVSIDLVDIGAIMPPSSVPPANLRTCPAAVGIALQ